MTSIDKELNRQLEILKFGVSEITPYDEFVDGGIYSYILKPKPEYAHLVEEFKVNLIYHAPNLS